MNFDLYIQILKSHLKNYCMSKEEFKKSVLHFDGTNYVEKEETYQTQEETAADYGQTVTPAACRHMIDELFKSDLENITEKGNEPYAVEFGKDSLLRILSQSGCEGIRFAFCKKPIDGTKTLVAIGIDSKGRAIKLEYFTKFTLSYPPVLEEKGNGKSLRQYVDELKSSQTEITPENLSNKLLGII